MMSSMASTFPIPFLGGYSATKASISILSKALSSELKYLDVNIPVIIIEPGLYKTGFNEIMFENKYDFFESSYFKEKETVLRTKEEIIKYLEKKDLKSIRQKIIKAIFKKNPKKIYRAPFLQKIGIFIYKIVS